MRILIISDTHGSHRNLEQLLEKVGPLDRVIHLGDVEGGEDYIRALCPCEVSMVRGNNDYTDDLPHEKELQLGNYRVLITHGHYYGAYMGTKGLYEEAVRRGFDIVMYGHIHRPVLEYREQAVILNPGSLSYPRQEGRKPSYILMEIDGEGRAHYTVNYLGADRAEKFYF